MEFDLHVDAFAALGHPGRLAVFRLLARRAPDGVRPSEIAEALGMKPNTLSVNVMALARAGLVTSERRGKSVFYSIDLARTGGLVDFLVSDCCRGRPELCLPLAARAARPVGGSVMTDRRFNVLFICTGNSARSIFAEAILAAEGAGRFRAFSAGTKPYSELNPHAVAVLRELGHDVSGLRAKNVAEFQGPDAPRLDFVFTVCDQAANEECPPWAGQPISAHWGLPDPVAVEGTEAEKGLAFLDAYRSLQRRISAFASLPLESLDRVSLQARLDAIARDARAQPAA
ncbi:metalloregulator ArsR/SmtB family transcription factor [Albimonas sp. CAU 1670]|uniref:metalloregulator ArsR/SmtB family transcription factor n=1 Tax=Albimonas sp. CAU 1670 TaxID=3032599 RepID=UPI0023DBACF4|nr:metalloregulator ArsR/SmtB family transcription factor [Albimonas sp. CAU 1670]MDF2234994.1 metalloregulator ArsR/SmtB family transcription factor [Albimonas sp. CAU 1670]